MITASTEMRAVAARMRTAAAALLESLPVAHRHAAQTSFGGPEHQQWTYFPGDRPGVRLTQLSPESRGLAFDLLATGYTERGYADLQRVIRLEALSTGAAGAETTRFDPRTAGDLPPYWLRVQGDPSGDEPWAWRISGHHLVATATVVGHLVAGTPQFLGASPARVTTGPHAGFRPLAEAEDLARALVTGLQPDQRRRAVVAASPPAEIASRIDPVASPLAGPDLPVSALDSDQQTLLEAVLRQYLDRATGPLADRAWSDLRERWSEVGFRWAGPVEPGRPHYYAISGPTFLVEYDNAQDGGNHIHSVWRDLCGDWGADLLADHYARHPHRHG